MDVSLNILYDKLTAEQKMLWTGFLGTEEGTAGDAGLTAAPIRCVRLDVAAGSAGAPAPSAPPARSPAPVPAAELVVCSAARARDIVESMVPPAGDAGGAPASSSELLAVACDTHEDMLQTRSWLASANVRAPALLAVVPYGPCALRDMVGCVFNDCAAWDSRLVDAIVSQSPTEDVLSVAAEMLANPVALFDDAATLVAYAGELPENHEHSIWGEVLKRGYSPMSYYTEDERRELRRLGAQGSPITMRPKREHGRTHLSFPVKGVDGERAGMLAQVDVSAPFTAGQQELLCHVGRRMSGMYMHEFSRGSRESDLEYSAQQLLNGMKISAAAIDHQLEAIGWSVDDDVRVAVFPDLADSQSTRDNPEMLYYRLRIKEALPSAVVIGYHGHYVVVGREREGEGPLERLSDLLFGTFSKDIRACGVSSVQHGFMNLRTGLVQARYALAQAERSGERGVFEFDRIFGRHLAQVLENSDAREVYFHPTMSRLLASGADADSFLLLSVYLLCGCSVSKASKWLYMHRNTAQYRVRRLEEAAGVSFSSLDPRETFRIIVSCALVLEGEGGTGALDEKRPLIGLIM